jgi:hypothetical protein
MRRVLLWSVLVGVALVLLAVLVVELRLDATERPPPDPRTPIGLPDGSTLSLGELLRRGGLPGPAERPVEPLVPDTTKTPGTAPAPALAVEDLYPGMPWGPVFRLAEYHRQADHRDEALALFESIPRDAADFAIARRRVAQELLARGESGAALRAARQALMADPLDGNSWEGVARTYVHELGRAFD